MSSSLLQQHPSVVVAVTLEREEVLRGAIVHWIEDKEVGAPGRRSRAGGAGTCPICLQRKAGVALIVLQVCRPACLWVGRSDEGIYKMTRLRKTGMPVRSAKELLKENWQAE